MRKIIILLSVFFLFLSFERLDTKPKQISEQRYKKANYEILVLKHPDLNLAPSDQDSIKIYEGFKPIDRYLVIGAIGIYGNADIGSYKAKKELKEKAAEIGGDALILIDVGIEKKEILAERITGISIPHYFWWPGDPPRYMGTDYYISKLPKVEVSTYSKAYLVVEFTDKMIKWLEEKYKVDWEDYEELMLEKDKSGNSKYTFEQAIKIAQEIKLKKKINN